MNAKEELLGLVEEAGTSKLSIKCARIVYGDEYSKDRKIFLLPVGYSKEALEKFLEFLNFDYDAGYGGQNLFGTIWFKDSTWAEREEYDGSEWWEYRIKPSIPEELEITDIKIAA